MALAKKRRERQQCKPSVCQLQIFLKGKNIYFLFIQYLLFSGQRNVGNGGTRIPQILTLYLHPPPFFPRLSKRERNGRRRRDRPSKKKQRRNFRRRRRGILTQIFGLEKEEKQKKYFGGKTVEAVHRSNSMACFA